jgi:hypothetical protein
VDGPQDGGIDAFYFLINRELVREDSEIVPKTASTVNVVILQIKSGEVGFQPGEVDKLFFFVDDLLDLSRPVSEITNVYRPELLSLMATFKDKYSIVWGDFPTVSVEFFDITRGDMAVPNAAAIKAAERVKNRVREHLSKATAQLYFVNAQRVLEQVQLRPPTKRELVWSETPVQTDEGYIGLVRLADYYDFIKDQNGNLADGIFESNVRASSRTQ